MADGWIAGQPDSWMAGRKGRQRRQEWQGRSASHRPVVAAVLPSYLILRPPRRRGDLSSTSDTQNM